MNPELVQKKLDALTKDFQAAFGVQLWGESPMVALADLAKPVTDYDALKARMASLAALFDHFNKRSFDAAVGASSGGTRLALVAFLKHRLPDFHPRIEGDVQAPMGFTCLLRDYLLHTKNRNYKKALNYFGLPDPIDDPTTAWSQVLFKFSEWLDSLRALLNVTARPRRNSAELSEEPLRFLVMVTYQRRRRLLESEDVAPILNEIVRRGSALDTELARVFGRSVDEIRRRLYELTNDVLIVSPVDRNATRISVSPPMLEAIRRGGLPPGDGEL